MEAFELWLGKAQGNSACDFTFHMGVSRYDAEAEKELREIVKRGVSSFKVFLAYKGALGVTDEELFHALRLAGNWGSSRPPIARTRIWSRNCKGSFWPRARPGRSGITGAARRGWRPKGCII